jgi:hypothetical protein
MLAGRRTLRWRRESAPGLAVVTAAGLPEHHAKPQVARCDDDPAGQWDLAFGEVPDRSGKAAAAAMAMHLRTVAWAKPTRQTDERSDAARLPSL